MKEKIHALQLEISKYPQLDLSGNTEHYFADGMYCRVLHRPAGTLIVGKIHKKEHLYIVASGIVQITNGDEVAVEVEGPKVIVSQPGTKRAVWALTDATCITVHRVSSTNLEDIEKELVEEDKMGLFDVYNKPRLEDQS